MVKTYRYLYCTCIVQYMPYTHLGRNGVGRSDITWVVVLLGREKGGCRGGVLLGFRGLLPLSEIKAVKKAATRTPNPGLYNVYNLKICNEIYKPFRLYLHPSYFEFLNFNNYCKTCLDSLVLTKSPFLNLIFCFIYLGKASISVLSHI